MKLRGKDKGRLGRKEGGQRKDAHMYAGTNVLEKYLDISLFFVSLPVANPLTLLVIPLVPITLIFQAHQSANAKNNNKKAGLSSPEYAFNHYLVEPAKKNIIFNKQ